MELVGWLPLAFCSVRMEPKGSYDYVHVAPVDDVRFAIEPSPSWR